MVLWFPEESSSQGWCWSAGKLHGCSQHRREHFAKTASWNREKVGAPGTLLPSKVCRGISEEAASSSDRCWRGLSGVPHASPACSCHFPMWLGAAAISLNTLFDSGGQSCFMSTIFTKTFPTEKPGSPLPNKGGCSWKSGWKEMKLLIPKQKLMQMPWLFHDFSNTEKIWLIHPAVLELVHQPPAHFLTI